MLHVAVAGALTDSLDALRRTPTRTTVLYSPLHVPSVNFAQLDLVVFLKNDPSGSAEVERLTSASALPPAVAAAWADVPTGPALDAAIQQSLFEVYGFVVGYTEAMHRACRWLRLLTHPAGVALRLPIHVTGETGTGKDLIARAVHRLNPLSGGQFVAVNIAAFPADLAVSALFGHKRGAFTGAMEDRVGAIRQAQDGVLFLDEIGDAPPSIQVALLRFLDGGEYSALGSDKTHTTRTQLVTATNADLTQLVRAGRFRADLLHRLSGMTISLPPLRERRDDIPLFVRTFLKAKGLSPNLADEVEELLLRKDWPGNIRQLKTFVDQFALLRLHTDAKDAVRWFNLDSPSGPLAGDDSRTLDDLRHDFDRRVLTQRLRRFAGDTRATAESLGISRRSVYDLARRLGVNIQGVDSD
jgi:DNA-binding NtrC family response regulator